ncbi:putative mediator of RNA polymerase II transcription subunit 17 [Gossypium hirsutum]|uniref:Mediator of RNA polymerase II transcription subunit 17 n=1 Tax=Gossypium hirsutum TaxID=3635 RepID=A0ABM3BBT0_GOSHI|nr:putative mediator of RNA polymerase II transcription subunit 17 [Gossypium hirsutum]
MTKNIIKPDPVCSIQEKGVFQGIEREGGGEKEGIEGTAVGMEGMLGRGGSPLGNVVGSGGSAPGFGRLGKDGNGGKEKGIGGIAVGIVGTEGMLGRGAVLLGMW